MKKDITGLKFGRLTALEPAFRDKHNRWHWLCQCECGNTHTVDVTSLTMGRVRSCGCLSDEVRLLGNRRDHGMWGTRLHRIWRRMKTRCHNPNSSDYYLYGMRGISVCDEWRNSFQAFYDWAMANGYSDNLSIDRIDTNKNYEPANCRWVTNKEQQRNKRNTLFIEYNGQVHSLCDWAEITGIKRSALYNRIYVLHWDIERALKTGGDYH